MIVVIDYGMGNVGSIINMLKKVGAKAVATSDIAIINDAEKLILPGVGAFDNGMTRLDELGLIPVLNTRVLEDKIPVLGICLGMHLLTLRSEEGRLPGLGWIEAETKRFKFVKTHSTLKIPHMGWNFIQVVQPHWLFQNMYEDTRFYFVHSYHPVCKNKQNVLTTTQYGYEFSSIIANEKIIGVQFHPEKSHKYGMRLLRNFAEY